LNQELRAFLEISEAGVENEHLRSWLQEGKRVIGWLCTYVPEEIIYAAGLLPVRIMAEETIDLGEADGYLHPNICSFVRSCLASTLKNRYDFLDGLVSGNTCDAIRRLADVWRSYFPPPFVHILSIPHKISETAIEFYRQELEQLKIKLEEFTGKEISEQDLADSIDLYNRSRDLLKKINGLRVHPQPLVSGAEMLAIVKAGMLLPRPSYNELLERLLTSLPQRSPQEERRPRIVISGSILDQPQYLKEIEDLGCWVVADDLCTGSRYYWDLVEKNNKRPLEALASRYMSRVPCARMRPHIHRLQHLLQLVEAFKADGVIYEKIKFCDLYGDDYPMFKKGLEQRGIPHLELEREYGTAGGMGQARTRIEAFLEMLTSRKGEE